MQYNCSRLDHDGDVACRVYVQVVGWKQVTIVFVESVCRARTLSMTGLLLYYIADEFIVQWPQLAVKYCLTRYIGRSV